MNRYKTRGDGDQQESSVLVYSVKQRSRPVDGMTNRGGGVEMGPWAPYLLSVRPHCRLIYEVVWIMT